MSIIANELKLYKSVTVSNLSANGGKLSSTEVITGIKNNIFPDVSQTERLSGLVRYRKVFAKLTNSANEVLYNPKYHFRAVSPGEDRMEMFVATQTDTQIGITGLERMYGSGALKTNATVGNTTLVCVLENLTQDIFESTGNTIFITDGINEEYFTNVVASVAGLDVTLTLPNGFTLLNNYIAGNTSITSVISDTTPLTFTIEEPIAITAGDGTYDSATFPVTGDNIGTIEDSFTLTFISDTAFTCANSALVSIGSGNTLGNFAPTNTVFSRAYFTLLSAGWVGTWAVGDTLRITTHPSAKALWIKQSVPVGCASFSGDNFTLRFAGESA